MRSFIIVRRVSRIIDKEGFPPDRVSRIVSRQRANLNLRKSVGFRPCKSTGCSSDPGSPADIWTWTSMSRTSMPWNATVLTRATMLPDATCYPASPWGVDGASRARSRSLVVARTGAASGPSRTMPSKARLKSANRYCVVGCDTASLFLRFFDRTNTVRVARVALRRGGQGRLGPGSPAPARAWL